MVTRGSDIGWNGGYRLLDIVSVLQGEKDYGDGGCGWLHNILNVFSATEPHP